MINWSTNLYCMSFLSFQKYTLLFFFYSTYLILWTKQAIILEQRVSKKRKVIQVAISWQNLLWLRKMIILYIGIGTLRRGLMIGGWTVPGLDSLPGVKVAEICSLPPPSDSTSHTLIDRQINKMEKKREICSSLASSNNNSHT